jgi:hypothetical protein
VRLGPATNAGAASLSSRPLREDTVSERSAHKYRHVGVYTGNILKGAKPATCRSSDRRTSNSSSTARRPGTRAGDSCGAEASADRLTDSRGNRLWVHFPAVLIAHPDRQHLESARVCASPCHDSPPTRQMGSMDEESAMHRSNNQASGIKQSVRPGSA